jgi:hypothetical protein
MRTAAAAGLLLVAAMIARCFPWGWLYDRLPVRAQRSVSPSGRADYVAMARSRALIAGIVGVAALVVAIVMALA